MLEYLDSVDDLEVIRLADNLGPNHILNDRSVFAMLPRLFCLTDPDLQLNADLPANFLGELASLTDLHRVGKAGFALEIGDRHLMRDDLIYSGGNMVRIWEHEDQFWHNPLPPLPAGDPVYDAILDTTFALYNKDHFQHANIWRAVRVGGRFTARHLPWYREASIPIEEARAYAKTQRYSTYLRDTTSLGE
ncbi:hypothetical protein [Methylobacterium sp. Gmos1]